MKLSFELSATFKKLDIKHKFTEATKRCSSPHFSLIPFFKNLGGVTTSMVGLSEGERSVP
jgi:hypothetical protein